MRSLLMVASLALLTACSTTHSGGSMPSALAKTTDSDVTGRWTGTWIGTGLFESPREDEVILEIKQVGNSGYGRVVCDGSVAAESVPWNVRREGLAGARVSARIRGSRIQLKHELGGNLFAADLKRVGDDRMIGDVRGASPGVQLVLTRVRRGEAPQARVMPAPPAQPPAQQSSQQPSPQAAQAEPEPAKVVTLPPIEETKPAVTEPATEPDPVQIAKVLPSEEPQLEQPSAENGGRWNGAVSWPICRTTWRTTSSPPEAFVTQSFPIVPMGVLSNGPRLPKIVPFSPGFSSPCGARSAHAHSPAPGLSFIAASLAHLNGVLITLPPSVLNVLSGPRQ